MDGQMTLFDYECEQSGVEKYVRKISYEETKPFLLGIHYARRMPCITDAFGLFKGGEMIGVVTYGIPASHTLCIGIAGEKNRGNVLELNRLVIAPERTEKNLASFLVSRSLKMLPNGTFVVSYADTAWSHIGYIYQATNFLYTGLTKARTDKYSESGHSRHYKDDEDRRQYRSAKHRYIYLVGDKRTRKRMMQELRYTICEYPKGNETRYDTKNPIPVIKTGLIEKEEKK